MNTLPSEDSRQTLGAQIICYKTYEKRKAEAAGQEAQERGPGEALEERVGDNGGGGASIRVMDHPRRRRSAEEDERMLGLSQTQRIKKGIKIREDEES